MQTNDTASKTSKLVMTAMIMCIIIVAIFLFRIPIPFTQGYVNLSDAVIFIGIITLGRQYGAIAGALGCMLGDVLAGFAMWAPWSFGIKGGMALLTGTLLCSLCKRQDLSDRMFMIFEILAMAAGGLFMAFGYFIAERVMYGNWAIAALGIPWNICQFCVGIVLAVVITEVLHKTNFRRYFAYKKPSH